MKDYMEGMRALRDSLDKVWDELTDTLKHKFGGLEDTEVKIGCLFHWKEANT